MVLKRLLRVVVPMVIFVVALAFGNGCKATYEDYHGHVNEYGDCVASEATECTGRRVTVWAAQETPT